MSSVKVRDPRDILLAPVVSEKSYRGGDCRQGSGDRCEHPEPRRKEAAYQVRLRQAS